MIDVHDKSRPRLLGNVSLNPPFSNGQSGAAVHTAMPLGDRPFAIVTTEGERTWYFDNNREEGMFHKITSQPMNIIGMIETSDKENPALISVFPYPEVPEAYKKCHGENFNIIDGQRGVFMMFQIRSYQRRLPTSCHQIQKVLGLISMRAHCSQDHT